MRLVSYLVQLNGVLMLFPQFNDLPIKAVNGSIIYRGMWLRSITVTLYQTNIVRENGSRAALVAWCSGAPVPVRWTS